METHAVEPPATGPDMTTKSPPDASPSAALARVASSSCTSCQEAALVQESGRSAQGEVPQEASATATAAVNGTPALCGPSHQLPGNGLRCEVQLNQGGHGSKPTGADMDGQADDRRDGVDYAAATMQHHAAGGSPTAVKQETPDVGGAPDRLAASASALVAVDDSNSANDKACQVCLPVPYDYPRLSEPPLPPPPPQQQQQQQQQQQPSPPRSAAIKRAADWDVDPMQLLALAAADEQLPDVDEVDREGADNDDVSEGRTQTANGGARRSSQHLAVNPTASQQPPRTLQTLARSVQDIMLLSPSRVARPQPGSAGGLPSMRGARSGGGGGAGPAGGRTAAPDDVSGGYQRAGSNGPYSEDADVDAEDDVAPYLVPTASKRVRLAWTPELHAKFVKVVEQLGPSGAVPKTILNMMNVRGLTREQVASHLQKYRLHLKKGTHQNVNVSWTTRRGSSSGGGGLVVSGAVSDTGARVAAATATAGGRVGGGGGSGGGGPLVRSPLAPAQGLTPPADAQPAAVTGVTGPGAGVVAGPTVHSTAMKVLEPPAAATPSSGAAVLHLGLSNSSLAAAVGASTSHAPVAPPPPAATTIAHSSRAWMHFEHPTQSSAMETTPMMAVQEADGRVRLVAAPPPPAVTAVTSVVPSHSTGFTPTLPPTGASTTTLNQLAAATDVVTAGVHTGGSSMAAGGADATATTTQKHKNVANVSPRAQNQQHQQQQGCCNVVMGVESAGGVMMAGDHIAAPHIAPAATPVSMQTQQPMLMAVPGGGGGGGDYQFVMCMAPPPPRHHPSPQLQQGQVIINASHVMHHVPGAVDMSAAGYNIVSGGGSGLHASAAHFQEHPHPQLGTSVAFHPLHAPPYALYAGGGGAGAPLHVQGDMLVAAAGPTAAVGQPLMVMQNTPQVQHYWAPQ